MSSNSIENSDATNSIDIDGEDDSNDDDDSIDSVVRSFNILFLAVLSLAYLLWTLQVNEWTTLIIINYLLTIIYYN